MTGTGTGVGKTVVTAAVAALAAARGSRVAVVKPAQTGVGADEPGDLADVRRLAGVTDLHELARYPDPLSPAAAARHSGLDPLDLRSVAARVRELADDRDLVLVEGAGGLLVRYDEEGATVADLAHELAADVLVVVDPSLGTLNHTALTLEAMAHRGLRPGRRRDRRVAGRAGPGLPQQRARPRDARRPAARRRAAGRGRDRWTAPSSCWPPGPAWPPPSAAPSMRQTSGVPTTTDALDILATARSQVLDEGRGLDEAQVLEVLQLPDDALPDLLALAHEVRLRWCGPEVEVEGIVSVKTGGCPEDCHFCSQSGLFPSPVRAAWLDIPSLVQAAVETAATGATEFCIVAAVRGPDERLMAQMREGVAAIRAAVDINVAASLGMLTQEQVDDLADMGVHRYNHNLETARSYFPQVVTTHTWEERWSTLTMVRDAGMEVCCGGIVGMGESLEQRAELAAQLAELTPDEVPLNFLNPRPGTPFGDLPVMSGPDALRTIAAFRLALPRTILRYAGGREITLGDLGTRDGMLGGINAVIVGNYLTTLGRSPEEDLALLGDLGMPVKALSQTL